MQSVGLPEQPMHAGSTLSMIALAATAAAAQPEVALDMLRATWTAREARSITGDPAVTSWVPLDTALSGERLRGLTDGMSAFQDDAVADAILLFGGPRRSDTELMLGLATPWLPLIADELREAGLPDDLKYVPLALSAMNPCATNTHGEAGPWMLSDPVAVRYGLVINDTIDQRHDMVRATTAAVRYMKHLYSSHPPDQALLAILCGPANLARAKIRSGGAATLAALYPHADAAERDRVPAFMALRYLVHYANDLGIRPTRLDPPAIDTLRTGPSVRRTVFTTLLGVDPRAFAELNPVIVGHHLPASTLIRVPQGAAGRYISMADSIAHASAPVIDTLPDAPILLNHTVRSGEYLGGIAEDHGVSVAELMEWNGLESDLLHEGMVLRVRVPATVAGTLEHDRPDGTTAKDLSARSTTAPEGTHAGRPRVYTVRRGDTLSAIAKRYKGVSARDIMRYNGIGETIRAGQRIKIPLPR